jgi:hypothetical protein
VLLSKQYQVPAIMTNAPIAGPDEHDLSALAAK